MSKKRSSVQNAALLYSLGFFLLVISGHIPGVQNVHGMMFGVYHVNMMNDTLHLASALWALYAGLTSTNAAVFYFRTFGTIYFLDSLMGLFTGYNFLNLGFLTGNYVEGLKRLAANAPHFFIGGSAMLIGFYFFKKSVKSSKRKTQ
jgi:hypothetical protein